MGASWLLLKKLPQLPGIQTKNATFIGSTHECFLGASFCDIINGSLYMKNSNLVHTSDPFCTIIINMY